MPPSRRQAAASIVSSSTGTGSLCRRAGGSVWLRHLRRNILQSPLQTSLGRDRRAWLGRRAASRSMLTKSSVPGRQVLSRGPSVSVFARGWFPVRMPSTDRSRLLSAYDARRRAKTILVQALYRRRGRTPRPGSGAQPPRNVVVAIVEHVVRADAGGQGTRTAHCRHLPTRASFRRSALCLLLDRETANAATTIGDADGSTRIEQIRDSAR